MRETKKVVIRLLIERMEMEMKAFIEKTYGKELLCNKVHERYL